MDQVILHTDARVVNFYREWNQDADGRISEEDFIRFYRIKAAEKPEAVWKNLTNAKYGNDLKPLTDMNSPDD
jgi:beta-lactamase class D